MAPRLFASSVPKGRATNGQAGPSRLPAQPSKTANKKRPVPVVEDEESEEEQGEFEVNGEGFEISDDEDGDDEAMSDEEDDEEFPELDSGSEEGDVDEEEDDEEDVAEGRERDEDDSEEDELDDEESGSESGYNTSDIEAMYSSSTSVSSSPRAEKGKELSIDEKLSRLVAKNTVKPDESIGTDEKISRAKEGTGKLRPSKLVPGGYLREYEEIDAGYGSESSTEDVSCYFSFLPRETQSHRADGRTRTRSETSPWNGTMTSRISVTTCLERKSSDRPKEMSSTSSSPTSRTRRPGPAPRTSCCSSRSNSQTESWISLDVLSGLRTLTRTLTLTKRPSSGSPVKDEKWSPR